MIHRSGFYASSWFSAFRLCVVFAFISPSLVQATVVPVLLSVTSETPITIDLSSSIISISNPNVTIATQPQNGVAEKPPNTTVLIQYTSNSGFVGVDSFEYQVINDIGQPETATISVAVMPPLVVDTAPGSLFSYSANVFSTQEIDYPGFNNPILGDLNGDDTVDIVGYLNGQFLTLLNDGTGQLTELNNPDISDASVLYDMDGDNDLDLVTTHLEVWLNNGSGVFDLIQPSPGNDVLTSMDVADMDGDGDGDVIGVLNNGLQLWLNNGHGRFTRGDTIGNSPVNGFRLGDLDCDSDKDIYIAIDGVDELWLNNGSAQFTRRMQAFSSSNTSGVQLGDVDGDADLDAVVTHTTQSQLWLNDGSGIFMLIPQFDITTSAEHRLHLIDLNNDGRSDIVTEILYPFGTEFFNVLSARLSIGDGVFVGIPDFNHLIRSGSVSRNNIKIADLNGDQFNDMLVTYTETSQILLNSVNNNYGAILADPNIGIMSVQVRDRFVQVLESDNEANISITPVVVSSAGLSVNYSTQDYTALAGEDYVETSGTLSWSPGDNSEKTVSVDLLPDQVAESGEALLLRLEFSSNQNLSKVITTPIVILYDEFPHSVANQCAVNLPIGDDTGGSGGGLFGRFILLLLFFVAMVRLYKPRLSFS